MCLFNFNTFPLLFGARDKVAMGVLFPDDGTERSQRPIVGDWQLDA